MQGEPLLGTNYKINVLHCKYLFVGLRRVDRSWSTSALERSLAAEVNPRPGSNVESTGCTVYTVMLRSCRFSNTASWLLLIQ